MEKLQKIELPDTMKEIKELAFAACRSLEEIEIPESMEKIGSYAFGGCTSLKKIVLKNPQTKISPTAFKGCTALEEVDFQMLKRLPLELQCNLAIGRIHHLETLLEEERTELIVYLKKKRELRNEIFLSGDGRAISFLLGELRTISLDLVEEYLAHSIGESNTEATALFLNYKKNRFKPEVLNLYKTNKELVEMGLELPTLKQFKRKWNCRTQEGGIVVMEYIGTETQEIIPAQLADGKKIVAIEKKKSSNSNPIPTGTLTHVVIDAEITSLTDLPFHTGALESITLPDTLETIGECAFAFCRELKNVVLPPNLKKLPKNIFQSCTSLEEITLPEHLEEIESFAFLGCQQLKVVHFPEKVISIHHQAFNNCRKFADDQGFQIIQGVLSYYFGTEDLVIVPDSVTKIADSAFYLSSCKEVVLPESVKIIGRGSFFGRESLEKVTFPPCLEEIGGNGFANCPLLEKVTLPSGVRLGEGAFDETVNIRWT